MLGAPLLDVREEFPVCAAAGDGAVRAPFADELVFEGRGQLRWRVAVLGEDYGVVVLVEVGEEFEDVWEGGRGHGGEELLGIDY